MQVAVQLQALLRQDCRGQAAGRQQLASKRVVMGDIGLQQLSQKLTGGVKSGSISLHSCQRPGQSCCHAILGHTLHASTPSSPCRASGLTLPWPRVLHAKDRGADWQPYQQQDLRCQASAIRYIAATIDEHIPTWTN